MRILLVAASAMAASATTGASSAADATSLCIGPENRPDWRSAVEPPQDEAALLQLARPLGTDPDPALHRHWFQGRGGDALLCILRDDPAAPSPACGSARFTFNRVRGIWRMEPGEFVMCSNDSRLPPRIELDLPGTIRPTEVGTRTPDDDSFENVGTTEAQYSSVELKDPVQ